MVNDGNWSVGSGSGVGSTVVVDVCGGLCRFVDGLGGGRFWWRCAGRTADNLEYFGPECLDMASCEESEASLDAFVDGFLSVGEWAEDEELQVKEEPIEGVALCFPGR